MKILKLKLSLLFLLTLFFVVQSYSKKYGVYISSEELNGNVKLFAKSIYEAKNYFGETKTGDSVYSIFCKYDIKGKPIETVVSSYKNNGYGERGIIRINNNLDEKIIKEVSYTLEGKVEWYRITKLNEDEFPIQENMFGSNDNLLRKETYKYDKDKNMIEWNRYKSDGSLNKKETYKYDKDKNMIERNKYKSDGSIESKYNYRYDEKMNEIEEYNYDEKGNLKLKKTNIFNKDGYKIESNELNYYSNEKTTLKNLYKYDSKGNNIENIIFKNGSPHLKYNYTYGDNNNKILEIMYDSDGILVSKQEYKYDSFSNIIEAKSVNSNDNTLYYSTTYEYKYDNNQNWIQMIVLKNGIADYIEKRRIEYYE